MEELREEYDTMIDSENNWVFDCLVGFLHSPIWNLPLQNFIEEKCLIFEPADDGGISDKPEYTYLHSDYRNLVDMMLGSFMEDVGINAEQFEEACLLSRTQLDYLPMEFHKRLFRQVWAANDYDMFVKMMTHKNVELQLQALELIRRRFCAAKGSGQDGEGDPAHSASGTSTDASLWSDKDTEVDETDVNQIKAEKWDEEDVTVAEHPLSDEEAQLILKTKLMAIEDGDELEEDGVPTPAVSVESTKRKVSPEEMRERQEYLKRQRDRLVAFKREARATQLGDGGGARPLSAKMAQAVLTGHAPASAPAAAVDYAEHMRRLLVDRLKTEVVDKQKT